MMHAQARSRGLVRKHTSIMSVPANFTGLKPTRSYKPRLQLLHTLVMSCNGQDALSTLYQPSLILGNSRCLLFVGAALQVTARRRFNSGSKPLIFGFRFEDGLGLLAPTTTHNHVVICISDLRQWNVACQDFITCHCETLHVCLGNMSMRNCTRLFGW